LSSDKAWLVLLHTLLTDLMLLLLLSYIIPLASWCDHSCSLTSCCGGADVCWMWLCSAHSNKIPHGSHFGLGAAPLWFASLWQCCNVYGRQSFLWWVQTVSGAPPSAFWGSVYLWDLINYAVSAAGNTVCLQNKPLQVLHCPDLH